ncbi:UNVERIFIED_CONTAM: hypothetical protein H355_009948 [Colinus virginianus]|nr:hypothetical protein H355_009948 [Colinus virginianus]
MQFTFGVVCDVGAVPLLAKEIAHTDAALKRQVVVEAEIFPKILHCLKDPDEVVRKNAATCIKEVVRHTQDLAKFVVNAELWYTGCSISFAFSERVHVRELVFGYYLRLPGIMALGYIAAFSETLALAIIVSKGIPPLKQALVEEPEDHVKAAAAW